MAQDRFRIVNIVHFSPGLSWQSMRLGHMAQVLNVLATGVEINFSSCHHQLCLNRVNFPYCEILVFRVSYLCPGRRSSAQVIKCVGFFSSCPGLRPRARVIKCVGFFLYYFSSARKWTNCAIVPLRPCGLRTLYFSESWNETSKKWSNEDFSRMLIVMSVKPTYFDRRTTQSEWISSF